MSKVFIKWIRHLMKNRKIRKKRERIKNEELKLLKSRNWLR